MSLNPNDSTAFKCAECAEWFCPNCDGRERCGDCGQGDLCTECAIEHTDMHREEFPGFDEIEEPCPMGHTHDCDCGKTQ